MPRHTTSWKLATMLALGAVAQGCASFSWPKPAASATADKPAGAPSGLTAFTSKFASWFSWNDAKKQPQKTPGGPKRIDPTTDTALSLNAKAKVGPEVNVAMARMLEQSQKPREAEKQYQQALALDPKYFPALEGLAHLEDRESRFDEAIATYQKAIALSPQDGRLYNDLGVCLQRRKNLPEAVKAFEQAIRLQSDRPMYRNNLATALVEMNRPEAALEQLIAANGPATGHYNLGYLLIRKGDEQRAIAEFRAAATIDPACEPAQQWLAKLDNAAAGSTRLARGAKPAPLGFGGTAPSAPVAQAPVAQAPVAQAPVAQAPVVQAPVATSDPQAPATGSANPVAGIVQPPLQSAPMRYPRTYGDGASGVEAPLPTGYGGGPMAYQPAANGATPISAGPPASSPPPPSADAAAGPQLGPSARRVVPANPAVQ